MAEKYYAVKVGKKTGIFTTWEECKANVHGYPCAAYKSFKTREEALSYLGRNCPGGSLGNSADNLSGNLVEEPPEISRGRGKSSPQDTQIMEKDGLKGAPRVKIYVDGSYNNATKEFSYGMVVLKEEGEECFNGSFQDRELASMRNVAGEIKGAEAAMRYAMERDITAIDIYHDYEGIARWCLGDWKTNREGTRAYKAFYDRARKQVDIRFVKVTGHSGDKYNDMADKMARKALGID